MPPVLPLLAVLLASPSDTAADTRDRIGLKIRGGGRYDDVRMCVATPAGVNGGPAGDISFFSERALGPRLAVQFDLPVMRPILFAVASQMLQFEPSVFLGRRPDGELPRPSGRSSAATSGWTSCAPSGGSTSSWA